MAKQTKGFVPAAEPSPRTIPESWYADATAEIRRLRAVLELIASPRRPDGTWNRDREACRQLATDALKENDR